jgi:hypothetical protein
MLTIFAFAAAAAMTQPLQLVAEKDGDQTRLLVVGESAVPLIARYELEASSGSGNRSVQSGTVRLQPHQRTVLVSLRMSGPPAGWAAKLKVNLDGSSYEQAVGN